VPPNSQRADRKKLTWLSIGFVSYFCVMLYAFRYASTVPYEVFALCGVLNMAILLAFVFTIRRVHKRMQGEGRAEQSQVSQSQQSIDSDRRRLKGLWIGVGLYSLIFLNGLRLGFAYAGSI